MHADKINLKEQQKIAEYISNFQNWSNHVTQYIKTNIDEVPFEFSWKIETDCSDL